MKRAIDNKRLDMRSEAGQAIKRLQARLETDLGGTDNLSTQERLIVDRIVKKVLIVEALETYALSRKSIFKRNGELIGCLGRHYLSYTEALRRDLLAVGLQRRTKDVPNLQAYLEARASQADEPDHAMDSEPIMDPEATQDAQGPHANATPEEARTYDCPED